MVLGLNVIFTSSHLWTDSMLISSISGNAFLELFARIFVTIGIMSIIVGILTIAGKKRWIWPATLTIAVITIASTAATTDALNLWRLLPLALSGLVLASLLRSDVREYFGNAVPASTLPTT